MAFRRNFTVLEIYEHVNFEVCESAEKCREMLAVLATI